jgi:hypothetical protein
LMADIRADMRELRSEIHRIDHKIDRHFMWLAGIPGRGSHGARWARASARSSAAALITPAME